VKVFLATPANQLIERYTQKLTLYVNDYSGALIPIPLARSLLVEVFKVNNSTITITIQ